MFYPTIEILRINKTGLLCLMIALIPAVMHSQSNRPSQEFTFKLGTPYEETDGSSRYFTENEVIIGIISDFNKYKNKTSVHIQKLDCKTMTQVSVRKVEDLPEDYIHEGYGRVPGGVIYFYSIYDRDTETRSLYGRMIKYDTGFFEDKPQLIFSTDSKVAGRGISVPIGWGLTTYGESADVFNFYTSADLSKLLVQYRLTPEKKNDSKNHDLIGLAVFTYNMELKKIWNTEVQLPYTEKKSDILTYSIDSKGNAHMLAKVFKDNTRKERDGDGNPNYHFEVITVDTAEHKPKAINIDLETRHITAVAMKENNAGNIIVCGYYNKQNKSRELREAEGAFLVTISGGAIAGEMLTFDIPLDIINQFSGKRESAKNEKKEAKEEGGAGMKNLYFDMVVRLDDGGYLIAGEQYERLTTTRQTSSGPREYYVYVYEDILVTRIGADGKLMWMKKLPKKQKGNYKPGGMSYRFFKGKSAHYFFFLDHIDNLKIAESKTPATHVDGQGGYLTAYKVEDATGTSSKLSIFNTRDVHGSELRDFYPGALLQVNSNDLVMETYRKKEAMLLKISFNSSLLD